MAKTNVASLSGDKRIEELEQELAKTKAELADAHAELNNVHTVDEYSTAVNIDEDNLGTYLQGLEAVRDELTSWLIGPELSEAQRRRLLGSGVRRYGFIDKTSDLMEVNPQFIPQFIDHNAFKKLIRELEIIRNMNAVIQQIARINGDILLILGDEAFREALSFYGAVRDASRRRVPGARELFRIMQQFFKHPRRASDEPTEMELMRDIHALEHGTKDGKIVIENKKAHTEGGEHVVIDETHKPSGHWKEKAEGEIE
jgi:hypothetical protein